MTKCQSAGQHKLVALSGLFATGCVMLLFVAAGPSIIRTHGYQVFIPALIASGFLTIAATRFSASVPSPIGLLVVLTFALAMRLLLVGEEPFLSTDLYRYVWDGRVQAAGINPYRFVPADPVLAPLRDIAIYPRINRADSVVTPYPPLAEMFFFLVTRISETIMAMRLATVTCEIVIVAVLIDLLRRLDLPLVTVAAYAWHPLAIWEIANNGHVEALMVALMMLGLWLLVLARHVMGAVAVAFAITVKPYALFILPAFWRRFDWRIPPAVIVAIFLCYLPYLGAGKGVFGSLGGYLAEEGLTSGEGIWLPFLIQTLIGKIPGLTTAYVVIAAGIMLWLALRAASRAEPTPREAISDVTLLLTAGLFLMSPNYAWYLLALVPLIPLGAGPLAWVLTLGAPLLYRPLYLPPHNELIWKTLATVPFLLALTFMLYLRRNASSYRHNTNAE